MKWTDVQLIAEKLADVHSDVDPTTVRFTELRQWVLALPSFNDVPEHCGERLLEAIQQHWIDEVTD